MLDSASPAFSPRLVARLERARRHYADGRPLSAALHGRARHVLPGGHTRTVLHFEPFPFRVERAVGSTLTDVDGHVLCDLLGNYTAGLAGHSPGPVRDAITRALDRGWSFGSVHPDEIRFAELICRRFPAIDQVRFTNSGTEANLMAIATARHATGRPAVLGFAGGYHGGVLSLGGHGRGTNVPYDLELATFNDPDSVAGSLARRGGEIAAVLVEPMLGSAGCLPPEPGFLEAVIELSREHGALVIFDEVMTSRLAPGGFHERVGLQPDLVTLGKYLAGGMSFGAFGGRAGLMAAFDGGGSTGADTSDREERVPPLGHAGTFNNNVLTMAAGVATLTETVTPEIIVELNARGDRLRNRLNEAFAASLVPMCLTGIGSLMNVHPVTGPVRHPGELDGDERWRELFFFDAIDAGYYLARRGFLALSTAVGDAELDRFGDHVTAWIRTVEDDMDNDG